MSRTSKEQEAYLISQYFNGTYNDADFTCTCSGNDKPNIIKPGYGDIADGRTPPATPTTPTTPTTPVENNTPNGGSNSTGNQGDGTEAPVVTDATNNPTYPSTSGNAGTVSPTSDEIIRDALPTFPTTDVSAQNGGTVQDVDPSSLEPSNAGGWFLGLIAVALIGRKLMKGGKNGN